MSKSFLVVGPGGGRGGGGGNTSCTEDAAVFGEQGIKEMGWVFLVSSFLYMAGHTHTHTHTHNFAEIETFVPFSHSPAAMMELAIL